MVERRIPNPKVGGSSPSCPAKFVRCENEKFNRIYQNVKGRAWQGYLSDERASAQRLYHGVYRGERDNFVFGFD